jgi:hypothetical protein
MPIDCGGAQRERYKGRNVVERCFNKLKQWRGIAMRSDKTARAYRAAIALAATLIGSRPTWFARVSAPPQAAPRQASAARTARSTRSPSAR